MSDIVFTYGFVTKANFSEEIFETKYSEIQDELHDLYGLHVNLEKTLIFSEFKFENLYGLKVFNTEDDLQDFKEIVELVNRNTDSNIDSTNFKPYSSVWFNGADSYMSTYTLKDFENEFFKKP